MLFRSRCGVAQLASIRQMSRQVSRGSAGEYQADERAGVAQLSWPGTEEPSGLPSMGSQSRT